MTPSKNPLELVNEKVRQAIADAIVNAGLVAPEEVPAIVLEVPRDKAHGRSEERRVGKECPV